MEDDEKVCSVCGGSGLNSVELQDLNEEELQYKPIECPHCGGSGKEPE